jgi:cell division protein FtsI (penicillin-binding protein 3)
VVSAATSASVRNLLRAVVDNNPKALALDDYQTGGKTGTAQRVVESCHCYDGYVTSYVGFAPLNDPKILTYVVINNPRSRSTGSGTAALAYKDIMNFALPRYSVPPSPTNSHFKPQPITW